MKKKLIDFICFLFILLFTYAGAIKLMDYEKFTVQLGQSPLLTTFAGWIAWMIPTIEILISVLLAIPRFRLIGLYASFSLMVMFTAYIIAILHFSENVPCSCGGVLSSLGWTEHLIFNIGFVLLGLAGSVLQARLQHSDPDKINAAGKQAMTA